MTTMTQAQPPRGLWQNRTFLALWAGNTLSALGDGFHSVALGLWVLQATGSASAMGLVMAVRMLASLLGSVAGTVVDRVNRRALMLGLDLARVALVGAVAVLLGRPDTPLLALLVLTGMIAVAGQFFTPAFQASLKVVVGPAEVERATGLLQVTTTLSAVVGPLLGGVVVGLWGGWAAMAIDSATFGLSALLIWAGGAFASPRQAGEGASFWGDLHAGLTYMQQQPRVLAAMVLTPALNFFANAIGGVLMPVVVLRVWHGSSVQYGAIEAIFPLGFVVGAGTLLGLLPRIRRRGLWMVAGALVGCVLLAVVGAVGSVNMALPIYLVAGAAIAIPNLLFQTMLQTEVPTAMQGRVFGTMNSLVNLTAPPAMLLAGYLSDRLSPVGLAVGAGTLLTVTVLVGFASFPALRRYHVAETAGTR